MGGGSSGPSFHGNHPVADHPCAIKRHYKRLLPRGVWLSDYSHAYPTFTGLLRTDRPDSVATTRYCPGDFAFRETVPVSVRP
jgi:hypothetical protein